MTSPIYLDCNATTPPAPEVVETMRRALEAAWGNPSSLHSFGRSAQTLVEGARGEVQRLLGARSPEEVVFTSGGTEAINTAIHAALACQGTARANVVTSAVEHSAVKKPLEAVAADGHEVIAIGVDGEGRLDVEACLAALTDRTALLTLQLANNETGVVTPPAVLARLAEEAHRHGALVHVDAVQGPGKLPLSVTELGCDLLSISAHKFHGPKGVGALWVRRGALPEFRGLVRGGPQEFERRGGTQNVPGIAGLGCAAELARAHLEDAEARGRVRALRDRLEAGLARELEDVRFHGTGAPRLDNTTSVWVRGVDGELLLASLDAAGLAVSGGAACSARTRGPSPVLLAMGCSEEEAAGTLRLSLGRTTREEEVDRAVGVLGSVIRELRALSAP